MATDETAARASANLASPSAVKGPDIGAFRVVCAQSAKTSWLSWMKKV
jgi:hypothetical protein